MKSNKLGTLAFWIVSGIAIGVGVFTFIYARGYSYMTDDPAACANCHVMDDYYDAWIKGSHRAVAVCNDCHTPHNFVGKYATKASNGFWHSFAFTTGHFPDLLQIKEHNRAITEDTCRHCHQEIVDAIEAVPRPARDDAHGRDAQRVEPLSCIRCHATVGHWVR